MTPVYLAVPKALPVDGPAPNVNVSADPHDPATWRLSLTPPKPDPIAYVAQEASYVVARLIRAEKKACWRNALLAILALDELADAWYVEGYAVASDLGIAIEHGWIMKPCEQGLAVIEPTLALVDKPEVLAANTYYGALAMQAKAVKTLYYQESGDTDRCEFDLPLNFYHCSLLGFNRDLMAVHMAMAQARAYGCMIGGFKDIMPTIAATWSRQAARRLGSGLPQDIMEPPAIHRFLIPTL